MQWKGSSRRYRRCNKGRSTGGWCNSQRCTGWPLAARGVEPQPPATVHVGSSRVMPAACALPAALARADTHEEPRIFVQVVSRVRVSLEFQHDGGVSLAIWDVVTTQVCAARHPLLCPLSVARGDGEASLQPTLLYCEAEVDGEASLGCLAWKNLTCVARSAERLFCSRQNQLSLVSSHSTASRTRAQAGRRALHEHTCRPTRLG